jgi:deazaflavin-dependent oxidoreductase (nitroreductase family)
MAAAEKFLAPSRGERFFNRAFGFLVGIGWGFSHNYLLQVKGRKTGKVYSTPVNLLELDGRLLLVAPRGRTQWVRNAEAAGEVTLKKGSYQRRFHLRALAVPEKLPVLKAYLDRFRREVHRYYPVPPGSPPEAFAEVADRYPVFQLTEG